MTWIVRDSGFIFCHFCDNINLIWKSIAFSLPGSLCSWVIRHHMHCFDKFVTPNIVFTFSGFFFLFDSFKVYMILVHRIWFWEFHKEGYLNNSGSHSSAKCPLDIYPFYFICRLSKFHKVSVLILVLCVHIPLSVSLSTAENFLSSCLCAPWISCAVQLKPQHHCNVSLWDAKQKKRDKKCLVRILKCPCRLICLAWL